MNYAITREENTTAILQEAGDLFFDILLHGMTLQEKIATRKKLLRLWQEAEKEDCENRGHTRKQTQNFF